MSITIDIEKIIKTFGEERRIFQQEIQFQFELAWELQKQIERNNEKAKVHLEFLGCTSNTKCKPKRFYYDIVIIDEHNNYIVIELKYKTKKDTYTNGNKEQVYLLGHSAPDEGRYDYLLDIHRIELFKYKDENKYEYSKQLQNFEKGYAILLTNENQYWSRKKFQAEKNDTVDKNFSIGQGDVVSGNIHWNTEQLKSWMKSRKEFELKGNYTCNWHNYCSEEKNTRARNDKEFKYIITEIENN